MTFGLVRSAISVAAALLVSAGLQAQDGARTPVVGPELDAAIRDVVDVSDYAVRELVLPDDPIAEFFTTVDLGDAGVAVLNLERHSLRSPDFKLIVQLADGTMVEQDPPAVCTYRGRIAGDEMSDVRASLGVDGLSAFIRAGDGREWTILPLREVDAGVDRAWHVLSRPQDAVAPNGRCGAEDLGLQAAPAEPTEDGLRGTLIKIAQIGFDADFEYYQLLGSNTVTVVNDIESVMNGIEQIYERDVLITYEITQIVVRTAEPDPYSSTSAGTLLGQFDTEWTNNFAAVERDVAHLWTGKEVNGGTIGIAQTGTLCTITAAYGLSQSRYTTNLTLRRSLTAHELGHNWNALHCDADGVNCHIMCSVNGGCGDSTPTEFGATSIASISSFRNSRTCLSTMPDPVTPPFFDNFETGLVTLRWTEVEGAAIVSGTTPVNPPSPTRALSLEAVNSGLFQDDEIRSNEIMLVGTASPVLTYWVEHRGVENGEQLVVEVYTSSLRWQEVNRLTSDGVDQSAFTFFSFSLTGAQVHNAMRVRFRAEVNEINDRWMIDDVYVGTGLGGCCLPNGTCTLVNRVSCQGQSGIFNGEGSTCDNANCPEASGACCFNDGSCTLVLPADCAAAGGTFRGGGTTCASVTCPIPTGACCLVGGDCFPLTLAQCNQSSGIWAGPGVTCGSNPCAPPTGACCAPDGSCSILSDSACISSGGVWRGAGTTCGAAACPQPTGACCLPSGRGCTIATESDCAAQQGAWHGAGATCEQAACPPCPCDWNHADGLDSQDFFDFLDGFFAGDADFNGVDGTDSQDYFDFLDCFFVACPAS